MFKLNSQTNDRLQFKAWSHEIRGNFPKIPRIVCVDPRITQKILSLNNIPGEFVEKPGVYDKALLCLPRHTVILTTTEAKTKG